jgi:hypothetical protein
MRVTTGRRACLLAVKVDQIQEILLAPHGFTKDPFRRFSFFLTMNRGYIYFCCHRVANNLHSATKERWKARATFSIRKGKLQRQTLHEGKLDARNNLSTSEVTVGLATIQSASSKEIFALSICHRGRSGLQFENGKAQ